MPEQDKKRSAEPDLSSIEGNLFGVLFSFHEQSMSLLRRSSLDDEQISLVGDRIQTLLADITDEVKCTKDFNLAGRLEEAYDDVKRLVDELSGAEDGGQDG